MVMVVANAQEGVEWSCIRAICSVINAAVAVSDGTPVVSSTLSKSQDQLTQCVNADSNNTANDGQTLVGACNNDENWTCTNNQVTLVAVNCSNTETLMSNRTVHSREP